MPGLSLMAVTYIHQKRVSPKLVDPTNQQTNVAMLAWKTVGFYTNRKQPPKAMLSTCDKICPEMQCGFKVKQCHACIILLLLK